MPIYNAGNILAENIESILNQSYQDFELILVNDASTDNSLKVCLDYARLYENVKIINKEKNEGVSKARNDGINIAKGEYICFVDADDRVKRFWLENYASKNKPDLLCSGFTVYEKGSTKDYKFEQNQIYKNSSIIDGIENILKNSALNSPWSKCYKASIIKENHILFWENCNLFEDLIFSLSVLQKVKTIELIEYIGYEYHRDNSNLTKRYNPSELYINWSKRVLLETSKLVNGNTQSYIFQKVITSQFLLASFYPILYFNKIEKHKRFTFYRYILDLIKVVNTKKFPLNRYIYVISKNIHILDILVFIEYKAYKILGIRK